MSGSIHHASCVALNGQAVLIKGASGVGKSALSLQLMAMGCTLIADDQVMLAATTEGIKATCPPTLKGLIEARGIGILNADSDDSGMVRLVIDLDHKETDRIPKRREVTIEGHKLPLLHRIDAIHQASAIRQWMLSGRSER